MYSTNQSSPAHGRQRRKAERPAEIIAAASELFGTKGYTKTRMNDVADKAHVAKGTVFLYFETKSALFAASLDLAVSGKFDAHRSALSRVRQGRVAPLLRKILRDWFEALQSPPLGHMPHLVAAEGDVFPHLAKTFRGVVADPLRGLLRDVLESGVASGEFRRIEIDAVVESLMGLLLVRSIAKHSIGCDLGDETQAPTFVESTINLVIRGLAPTRPASKLSGNGTTK